MWFDFADLWIYILEFLISNIGFKSDKCTYQPIWLSVLDLNVPITVPYISSTVLQFFCRDFTKFFHSMSVPNLLTAWSGVLLEKLTGFQLGKKFPAFYVTQSSLPHSQVPVTCSYPQAAWSSPQPHIPLPEIHLNIILPSMPGSPKWSLSPPKPCLSLSSPPYTLHAPPISFFPILSPKQ